MSQTKAKDLRTKTEKELEDQALVLRKEQFNLRFQRATGQAQSSARVRQVRREIAQIETILGERRRQSAGKAA